MPAPHDIELMQHHDGELPERAGPDVAARLAREPEARARVEALAEIGELVRGHVELEAERVPEARFDAMWRAIDDATAPAAPAPAPGLWQRFVGWLDQHRGHVITGAVSAGAVAALALLLRPDAPAPQVADPVARVPAAGALVVQPAALRAAPEIEHLDTPDGEGTVLNLEDEDGHTTVIWVTPADTVEGI